MLWMRRLWERLQNSRLSLNFWTKLAGWSARMRDSSRPLPINRHYETASGSRQQSGPKPSLATEIEEVVTLLKSAMAGLYGSWESAQAFAQDWQNGLASQLMQASSSPLRVPAP